MFSKAKIYVRLFKMLRPSRSCHNFNLVRLFCKKKWTPINLGQFRCENKISAFSGFQYRTTTMFILSPNQRYLFASFGRTHQGNELMKWYTVKRKFKEPKTKIRRRADTWYTYINLGINDVYEAPKHNDEIKYIPRIPKVILPKEKHPIKRNMGLLTYWNSNKRWRRRWRWLWLCGTGRAGWAVVPCLVRWGRSDSSATSQPGHYVQSAWITK